MKQAGIFSTVKNGALLKLELPAQKLYEIWNYNNSEVCFSSSGTPVKRLLFGDVNNPCYSDPTKPGVHFSLRGYGQYHSKQEKPLEIWRTLILSDVLTESEKSTLRTLVDPNEDIGAYYFQDSKVYKGYSSELLGVDGDGEQYFLRIKSRDGDPINFGRVSIPMVDQVIQLERRGIFIFKRVLRVDPKNSKNLYELFLK